jgi:imidazolonepropionase-like amidohydrolase
LKTAGLLLALCVSLARAEAPPLAAPPSPARDKAYKLVNGRWFDGTTFKRRVLYAAGGVLTGKAPATVDEVVDLKDGFVVPPFGDAHNHYIAGPHDIDLILGQYLRDGIFYAKNPASIARDTGKIRDKINRPDGVDVVFANAGITASGGHPVKLYEEYLRKMKTPGQDGTFENLGYVIIDNQADLDKKWPMIMAAAPDFIKGHLLYSEEFEKRRDDPAFYGHRGLDPKVLRLIVDRAHADHLRVSCHIETAADFRSALAAGVDEINHMPGYFPTPDHPEWFPITAQDAALAARQGVVVVTTTYVAVSELAGAGDAAQLKNAREIQAGNLRLLRDAGVKIALGPDVYGVTALAEAMNLHTLKVLDNRALLKAWCETTAETIFPKRRIGRLEEGYEASFLVLGGDPIVDFEEVKDIRMRFKQGRIMIGSSSR